MPQFCFKFRDSGRPDEIIDGIEIDQSQRNQIRVNGHDGTFVAIYMNAEVSSVNVIQEETGGTQAVKSLLGSASPMALNVFGQFIALFPKMTDTQFEELSALLTTLQESDSPSAIRDTTAP